MTIFRFANFSLTIFSDTISRCTIIKRTYEQLYVSSVASMFMQISGNETLLKSIQRPCTRSWERLDARGCSHRCLDFRRLHTWTEKIIQRYYCAGRFNSQCFFAISGLFNIRRFNFPHGCDVTSVSILELIVAQRSLSLYRRYHVDDHSVDDPGLRVR